MNNPDGEDATKSPVSEAAPAIPSKRTKAGAAAIAAANAVTAPSLQNPILSNKLSMLAHPKGGSKIRDEVFDQVMISAITCFTRDQQSTLCKALAGVLGAHVSFPEARDNRVRGELLELITGKHNAPVGPKGGKEKSKPKEKTSKKEKNPAKPGAREIRASPEAKQLAAAQSALRDERSRLGIAKGDLSDVRLKSFTDALEQAKTAYYAVRDRIRDESNL